MSIEVTTRDLNSPGDCESAVIQDNYVLVTAGTCHHASVQVHRKSDGTETHVVTIRGIRQAPSSPVPTEGQG